MELGLVDGLLPQAQRAIAMLDTAIALWVNFPSDRINLIIGNRLNDIMVRE